MSQNSLEKYHLPGMLQRGILPSDELQKRKITNDLSRVFECGKIFSNVGLFASLHDNLAQGIILRSTIPITPAVTPIRQKRKSLTCKLILVHSSPY